MPFTDSESPSELEALELRRGDPMPEPVYTTRFMYRKNERLFGIAPVPAGYRGVVRDVSIVYGGVLGTSLAVAIGDVGFYSFSFSPTQNGALHWDGRAVIEAGENLNVTADPDGIDIVITGYLLGLP